MKKNGIRERIGPYEIISAIFLALVLVVALYPFIYVIAGSFSSGTDYMRGGISVSYTHLMFCKAFQH